MADLNRLDLESFDAALHLLDRQVVDVDGLLVCKVDDLELTITPDGSAAVTRILTGPAALVPRMSGRNGHVLRRRWHSLGIQYADRDVPLALPLDVISSIGSGIDLTVPREGLLDRQPPAPSGVTRRRLGELLDMKVETDHPDLRGRVLDVRLSAGTDGYQVRQALIGPGRPGGLLGYDRGNVDGPWMVGRLINRLHRHIRLVPWSDLAQIDWDESRVRIGANARADPP